MLLRKKKVKITIQAVPAKKVPSSDKLLDSSSKIIDSVFACEMKGEFNLTSKSHLGPYSEHPFNLLKYSSSTSGLEKCLLIVRKH